MRLGVPGFRNTPLGRVLLLGALVLLLQVPTCMIGQLAFERRETRAAAAHEVTQTWGAPQQLGGPFLAVPFRIKGKDKDGKPIDVESGTVLVIPERLDVQAQAQVETRRRGLYEVPLYRTTLKLTGRFNAPLAGIGSLVPRDALLWPQAQLVVRLSDVHALEQVSPLRWGDAQHDFQGGGAPLGNGLHARLPDESGSAPVSFAIDLAVRGSDRFFFTPGARNTRATLASNWPHPKFTGAWLPDEREIGDAGFRATWSVTSLAGGLPSAWKAGHVGDGALDAMGFGTELLFPVDPYRMSERTLKYDLLFLGLTFVAVWLFEMVTGRRVHPMQYLLVGAALCVFYLLELSLAEHFGFVTAYTVAAAAVTAQVALYARSVFRRGWAALGLAAVIAGLYALLYLLLGAEDYALLIGSATVFVVLSAVMFLTRRIEWGRPAGVTAATVSA